MKIITEKQISELCISTEKCLTWVEEALKIKEQAILPAKISMKPKDDVFCNVMPSIVGKSGGVKIVSRYPGREPTLESKLILFDSESGDFKALMDANVITTMRTAAVAVHSVKLLAKKSFNTVGLIGLGEIGKATYKMLLDTYRNVALTVKIYDYKNRAAEFANSFSDYDNVTYIFCKTVDEVVKDSDVILSAPTYVNDDFCEDAQFKKGVLVVPIHTRGFTNCDLFFDKVFGDDYGHICHFKYFDKFKTFNETAEIIAGKCLGRESDTQRILAYNIGISLHDIYFANKILEMLKSEE